MSNLRIAYIINDAAFFVSHRLTLALEVVKLGGEVCLIIGDNINKKIEEQAIKKLKDHKVNHVIDKDEFIFFVDRENFVIYQTTND